MSLHTIGVNLVPFANFWEFWRTKADGLQGLLIICSLLFELQGF